MNGVKSNEEVYLGDGLYASDDGYQFILRAPRLHGDDHVALEPDVLDSFFRFIERKRGLTIEVKEAAK